MVEDSGATQWRNKGGKGRHLPRAQYFLLSCYNCVTMLERGSNVHSPRSMLLLMLSGQRWNLQYVITRCMQSREGGERGRRPRASYAGRHPKSEITKSTFH